MSWIITRKIKTIGQMSNIEKWLLIEAIYTSAYVKFTLTFLPFKKVLLWLGKPQTTNYSTINNQALLLQVHHALNRCSRYTPWKTECYTQALTAKIILGKRKISSTLYIGFLKDKNSSYKGHAWLKNGEQFITGYLPDLQSYQIHSYFS